MARPDSRAGRPHRALRRDEPRHPARTGRRLMGRALAGCTLAGRLGRPYRAACPHRWPRPVGPGRPDAPGGRALAGRLSCPYRPDCPHR
ncbi:hypothetical protein GCM10010286_27370 [Streptomyces toxytricini]|nr:hypothetical protein GCM10010286_27370 [Streptomyces toxytricini]